MNEWRGLCLSPSLTLYSEARGFMYFAHTPGFPWDGGGSVLCGVNKWVSVF